MGYFRELPNLLYQSPLTNRNTSDQYVAVKNLFRRNKLRDDLQNVFTLFNKYEIVEGARPDTIAEELYGSAELDWVVIMTAGIVNIRDEWPLSNYHLYEYANNKYDDINAIHHYETTEVKDNNGRLILPKGKEVNSDFKIPNPDDYTAQKLNPVRGITNYEYEVRKNQEKSNIYLLKPRYLQQFLNDMRQIMTYQTSSQYIDERLIITENTRNTIPPA
jgi:hypothetical protein